jgi:hypothetical protein
MFVSILILAALQGASADASAPATDPSQEKVCKRIDITGSLARKERVCKTRAEWERLAQSGNATARAIVDWSTGRPSGQ